MENHNDKDPFHATGELGTSIWYVLWNSSANVTVRLFLVVGAVGGALGSFFFRSVPYWLTLGIIAGSFTGLLTAMLLEGLKLFIREIIHPTKIPGYMACPHCQKRVRLTEELLGKHVQCLTCSKIFLAPAQFAEDSQEPVTKKEAQDDHEDKYQDDKWLP